MTEQNVIAWNINDQRIAEAKEEFKDVDASKDLPGAKKAKKALTKMRTQLTEAHKEAKAEALAFGRTLDSEKNRLLADIKLIEDPISDALDEIKNREAREEGARIEIINNALENIQSFAAQRHDMDLDELQAAQKALNELQISEPVYQEFFEAAENYKEDGQIKLRIAISRETDRIKEERKQEQIRIDNEERQAALDAQQKAIDDQNAEIKANQDRLDQLARDKAAEELEDERKAQAEEQRLIDEENARERKRQAKEQKNIDDENAAILERRLAEEAEQSAKDEAARKLRLAPDSDKLERLAKEIEEIPLPQLESDEANRVAILVVEKMKPVIEYIRNEARKMK